MQIRQLNNYSVIFILLIMQMGYSQKKEEYKIHTVAFYNLENLFDTEDDVSKNDEASPIMKIGNNKNEVYQKKINNMASVITNIGKDVTNSSPSLIGLCEIENRKVLEDLTNDSKLISNDYGIVHFDSPDNRGIDVGLLYKKKVFQVISKSTHTPKIYDLHTKKRIHTRNQLLVTGQLEGETIHLIVNHWPSRRGGEAKSRQKRITAAKLNKRLIDSLQSIDPYAKVITMGDLNDNPNNISITKVMGARQKQGKAQTKEIYNPFIKMYKKGLGTTAYRDSWSLFDQIMLTNPLINKDYSKWTYYRAGIYNKSYLVTKKGRYKGYPFRSFDVGGFTNGYSDHFPVYIYLIKAVTQN